MPVPLGEGVVDPFGSDRVTHVHDAELVPEAGGLHPLDEAMAGVPERGLGGQILASAEAVQRDGEAVDQGAGHRAPWVVDARA